MYDEFNKAINKILNDTTYFLECIEDKEGNVYKGTLLSKIDGRKRDYLSTTLNPLASSIDALKTKVLPRSKEPLNTLVEDTINNLNQIMEEIRIHDGKPINKSNLVIDTHKIFKYNKKDVLILTYYSLIELYEEYGYHRKDFKSKALNEIKYKFGQSLVGNPLQVSLLSIKSDDKELSPKHIPNGKLSFPTYRITI